MENSQYMWHKEGSELSEDLFSQMQAMNSYSAGRGLQTAWTNAYRYYYNQVFDKGAGKGLATAGDSAEFTLLNVNHLRNLVSHIIAIVTGPKVSYNIMATTNDLDAQNSARVGQSIVNHLDATRAISETGRIAFEMGLVLGTSYIYTGWSFGKNLLGADENDKPTYAGDLDVRILSPFDVVLSPYKDSFNDQNWVVIRKLVNKFDLANEYPDQAEEILAAELEADFQHYEPMYAQSNEDIYLYEAFHKETPALPEGRYVKFIKESVVLEDILKNPYGAHLPVVCFRPGIVFGSAFGYTPVFDLIAMQEKLAEIDSTICSNQRAFGSQNIAVPRMSNISVDSLSGGLKLVEYDANPDLPNGGIPQSLVLLETPAELFNYRNQLVTDMEKLLSITPMNRGEVAAGLSSGTALAILSSQSLVANSALEANYVLLMEQFMTAVIRTCAAFMTEQELINVSGKTSASPISSFTGKDLQSVESIKVELGNPISRNAAGKVDTADKLLNSGLLSHPSQYFAILKDGTIDDVIDALGAGEQSYIKYENEQLLAGERPVVCFLDNPTTHILEHRRLLFMPDVRQNAPVLEAILGHITEHQSQLEEMAISNPMMLQLIDSGKAVASQPLASTRVAQPVSIGGGGSAPQQQGQQQQGGAAKSSINDNAAKAMKMGADKVDQASASQGA